MATYTKVKLSGSTDGKGIKVVQTSTAGDTVHTADSTALDEIWLYAVNSDTTARKVTLQYGGTSSPDNDIEFTVAPESGLVLVVPGLILTNSLVLKVFCATANVVVVYGFVNRIS